MIKKTISALLTILLLALAIVWLWDFSQVQKGFNPKFCIKENTYNYDDGKTYECVGAGYKVFKYQRKKLTATQFSPFWVDMQE